MKNLFLLAALFIIHIMSAQETTSIDVVVTNVPTEKGSVIFGLYTQEVFMVAAPTQSAKSVIANGKAQILFENVKPGTYAVLCFHDINGNETMDFEANGMPKEAYGASNNVMSMGPPLWEDVKFEVKSQPLTLKIRL